MRLEFGVDNKHLLTGAIVDSFFFSVLLARTAAAAVVVRQLLLSFAPTKDGEG